MTFDVTKLTACSSMTCDVIWGGVLGYLHCQYDNTCLQAVENTVRYMCHHSSRGSIPADEVTGIMSMPH